MNEREEVARGMAEHQRKIHGGEAWPEGFLWLADWHLARVREAAADEREQGMKAAAAFVEAQGAYALADQIRALAAREREGGK